MRHHKLNYVIVGLFVIAMVSIGFVSIVKISGQTRVTDDYHLVLDNVSDVKFGTQVRYEGYPIGQIEHIEPFAENNRMRFRLDVSIEEGWKLPKDSVARIGSSSLLSAKTIDITAGTSTTALVPGNEIASAPTKDMFVAMANLADEFGMLNRKSLRPLVKDIAEMARRLGGKLETDLARVTTSLSNIAVSVEGRSTVVMQRVDDLTRRLDERFLSEHNADGVDGIVGHAAETTRNFSVMSNDLKTAGTQVREMISGINTLVESNRGTVDKTLTNAQYSLQTVARNIDTIMQSIEVTSRNMSEFSRQIRQNSSLLLGGRPAEQVSPTSSQSSRFKAQRP